MAEIDALAVAPPITLPTSDQVAAFERDGHLHIPGALTAGALAEIAPPLDDFMSASLRLPDPSCPGANTLTAFSLGDLPTAVFRAMTSPHIGTIAARLLGVAAVRIWNCANLYKCPGAPGTHWHQDLQYLPLATDKMLTVWLPLGAVAADMSPLVYATGSHKSGKLDPATAMRQFAITRQPPLQAGDLSLHAGWMLHATAPNTSNRLRKVVGITYFADGARYSQLVLSPVIRRIGAHLVDARPGAIIAGPMNPIASTRSTA